LACIQPRRNWAAALSREDVMEFFLVGGAVRDKLLGLPVQDRDWVVVGATAETLLAQGFRQVGRDFPVFLHPDSGEEYALARQEMTACNLDFLEFGVA